MEDTYKYSVAIDLLSAASSETAAMWVINYNGDEIGFIKLERIRPGVWLTKMQIGDDHPTRLENIELFECQDENLRNLNDHVVELVWEVQDVVETIFDEKLNELTMDWASEAECYIEELQEELQNE